MDQKLHDPILSWSFLNVHGFVQKKDAIFYHRPSKYLLYDKERLLLQLLHKHRMYKVW